MEKALKRQKLRKAVLTYRPGIIVMLVIAVFYVVRFAVEYAVTPKTPIFLRADEAVDIEALDGEYVSFPAPLFGYFAENIEYKTRTGSNYRFDEKTTSRDYMMFFTDKNGNLGMMGLRVEPEDFDDAEAAATDMQNYLADDTGTYQRDSSVIYVEGTVQKMDDETKALWDETVEELSGITDSHGVTMVDAFAFYPYVVVDGDAPIDDVLVSGAFDGIFLTCYALVLLYLVSKKAKEPTQIESKIALAPGSPTLGGIGRDVRKELNGFYAAVPPDAFHLRMDRNWLMYFDKNDSWVLPASQITWVYAQADAKGKWQVCVRSDFEKTCYRVSVPSAAAANDLQARLAQLYPYAFYGYTAEADVEYLRDPRVFHARACAMRTAQSQSESV